MIVRCGSSFDFVEESCFRAEVKAVAGGSGTKVKLRDPVMSQIAFAKAVFTAVVTRSRSGPLFMIPFRPQIGANNVPPLHSPTFKPQSRAERRQTTTRSPSSACGNNTDCAQSTATRLDGSAVNMCQSLNVLE